jgi:dTDP-glucose 4,6-dehydratase
MKNKTLLIIGGTGFFAKSIINFLVYESKLNNIKKIILLSRGNNKIKLPKEDQKKIYIHQIYGDISKLKKIPYADYIMYCAINTNYKEYYKGICNYYKLAKKYHSKSKILYTSSGAVYGQQPKNIKEIKENYLLNHKRIDYKNKNKNNYSLIKLKNEEIFKSLTKSNIKVSIARCFAFVGKYLPRNGNFVIGNLIESILFKKNLEIKADYNVIRSYMHENDLSNWLLKIVKSSNVKCPIYNVGSDKIVKIKNLAYALSRKYKLELKLKKIKHRFEDKYIPSIQKAKKELKLRLKYNSSDAVNNVIESIRQNKL